MSSLAVLASRFSTQAAARGMVLATMIVFASTVAEVRAAGELTLHVVDDETGETIPCRMHITNEERKPQKV
ncbi:MAG TPA: hypothetical protein VGX76_08455, partial [Pirellulales bacterium]|nr:hypothetical protein [Pirellulales bacterium]